MPRKTTVPPLWDAEYSKQRLQAEMAKATEARADRDWHSAEIVVERAVSDRVDNHRGCVLSRCRRTRRCIGDPPVCWQPRIIEREIPAKLLDWMDQVYFAIQREREAAAREGRAPRVLAPGLEQVERGKR